jgi:hypothetical protein
MRRTPHSNPDPCARSFGAPVVGRAVTDRALRLIPPVAAAVLQTGVVGLPRSHRPARPVPRRRPPTCRRQAKTLPPTSRRCARGTWIRTPACPISRTLARRVRRLQRRATRHRLAPIGPQAHGSCLRHFSGTLAIATAPLSSPHDSDTAHTGHCMLPRTIKDEISHFRNSLLFVVILPSDYLAEKGAGNARKHGTLLGHSGSAGS